MVIGIDNGATGSIGAIEIIDILKDEELEIINKANIKFI